MDRCVTPWLVAAMHRPMYVVYPHKSNRIVGGALPRLMAAYVHWLDSFRARGRVSHTCKPLPLICCSWLQAQARPCARL